MNILHANWNCASGLCWAEAGGGRGFKVPFGSRRVAGFCAVHLLLCPRPIWTIGSRTSGTRTSQSVPCSLLQLLTRGQDLYGDAVLTRIRDRRPWQWSGRWHPGSVPTSHVASRTFSPCWFQFPHPSQCSKDYMSQECRVPRRGLVSAQDVVAVSRQLP